MIDSYACVGSNQTSLGAPHGGTGTCCCGDTFQVPAGPNYTLTTGIKKMMRYGSPTGNLTYVLYARDGGKPTGAVLDRTGTKSLATTSNVKLTNYTLTFAGGYQVVAGNWYCFCIEIDAGATIGGNNYITSAIDASGSHAGTEVVHTSGNWYANANPDECFSISGTAVSTGISIPVAMHHYSQMTRIHRG